MRLQVLLRMRGPLYLSLHHHSSSLAALPNAHAVQIILKLG